MSRPAFVLAIVGAESTGKSQLARALYEALQTPGEHVAQVDEYLREFCDREGRTPSPTEQRHIAAEQTRRIATAASTHTLVIADTTALMTAVYSETVFGDTTLYAQALQHHTRADLTLLTALDLPWQPDGLQRDGPQVREPVDRLLRAALMGAGLPFSVVAGRGEARVQNALRCLQIARQPRPAKPSAWRHLCARCGDGDCEHALFQRLAEAANPPEPSPP